MPVQKRTPAAPSRAAGRAGGGGAGTSNRAANAAAPGGNAASLNPEDFTQGGLLDDIDVTFSECRFVEWDYDGSIQTPVLALAVTMDYDDGGKPAQVVQYYSSGDLSRFQPSEDGRRAISVAGAKGLNSNTNAALLLKSVIEQGFPVDRFGDGDIGAMDGMFVHINRVPQPKRGGGIAEKNAQGYEKTVAIVTKIHRMPWEKATKAAVPKAAPARTAAPASNGAADLTDEAATILVNILEAKGGEVKKSAIPGASFKHLAGNPNRSAILQLLTDDEFLSNGADYGWEFDGQTVSAV